MVTVSQKPAVDFYRYPSVGKEDYRYTFAAAKVRVLQSMMLTRSELLDMSNSPDFESAVGIISGGEYAISQPVKNFSTVQQMLIEKRSQLKDLFDSLIMDDEIKTLFRSRTDFANVKLALRHKLTDRAVGEDCSGEGNIPGEQIAEIFEQENYSLLPEFMQQAVENAVLAYYQDKDIRRIDYALDKSHSDYKLEQAEKLDSVFLTELFRMQADLTNITTMLRMKFTEMDLRDIFLEGGYIEMEKLTHCLDVDYDAVSSVFFATPYYDVVDSGVGYLRSNKSFLKLERNCEEHINRYLDETMQQITAGPQPVMAYLLLKEYEIRMVRLILTAKRNSLEAKLITDRLGE